ncbi:long-chain fatty acid--CoA ligase [Lacibacterium aquatile]|uniref:Long-chain fatty acid--CoA ligase n=1 Tax=Lacibacterium aquatile TaxID=1168082 RepID=A0ABW5DT90_9PROT
MSASEKTGHEASGHEVWRSYYPRDVDFDTPVPVAPLYQLLDESVATYGARPCIDFLGKKYTYAEVGAIVDRVAAGLQRQGVGKGTKVGLFLPNCPYFIFFYYGVLKAGGTVVNFNPLYVEREIEKQIVDSETKIMVTLDLHALYPKLQPFLASGILSQVIVCPMADILPFPKNFLFPLIRRADRAHIPADSHNLWFRDLIVNASKPTPIQVDPERDIAVLQYTGGTTGTPKGAMLSHANLYANAVQSLRWCPMTRPGLEKMLGLLPFFHVFAMTVVMNKSLLAGSEIIMLPRFDLEQAMKTIHEKRPTLLPGVPTIYAALANHKDLQKYDLRSIRICISGGAPLPVEVKKQFEDVTGCSLIEGYGLTEASPVCFANPLSGTEKAGAIGLPLPQTYFSIRNPANPTEEMPDGERGELCVKGPQVMLGYWRRPEETAAVMVDGYLRTGDIGYLDSDGYVCLVDRIKDLIICGGYNVYPRTVEEAIYQHPAVAEVTVIGIQDKYRGETVKAFVVCKSGQDVAAEALINFLKDKLSPIEMPKHIEFRTSLPKTMIGKLSKKELVAEEREKAKLG